MKPLFLFPTLLFFLGRTYRSVYPNSGYVLLWVMSPNYVPFSEKLNKPHPFPPPTELPTPPPGLTLAFLSSPNGLFALPPSGLAPEEVQGCRARVFESPLIMYHPVKNGGKEQKRHIATHSWCFFRPTGEGSPSRTTPGWYHPPSAHRPRSRPPNLQL